MNRQVDIFILKLKLTLTIEDILTEHGGILHVLPLAVHLKYIFCWTSRGYSDPFLLFEFIVGPLLSYLSCGECNM